MIIAIDYDGTYMADPYCFSKVISTFQNHGHTVVCITNRSDGDGTEVLKAFTDKKVQVIFAGKQGKRKAASGFGFNVDIWLDDMPATIDEPIPLLGSNG